MKIQILFFIFFIIISSIFFISFSFALSCRISSSSCGAAEYCLFSLYQQTNSHLADCSAYNYKVCCDFNSSEQLKASCDPDEVGIISLNKISNSHAEIYGYFYYGNHVCVRESLSCNLKTSCEHDEACVVSFYNDLNSHAADCSYYANKLCCRSFKPYTFKGIVLDYASGLPIESGVIKGIIKETGEVSYSSIGSDGSFILKFNTTLNATSNKFTLSLVVNSSDNKMGYVQVIAGSGEFVETVQTCSIKQWHFTGRALDATGMPMSSGNVMISVEGEPKVYTNSTTFTNGMWDIYISPCLIPGNLYTFQITVSSGDKISNIFIGQLAK